jgi:spermidine synthase
MTRLLLGAGLPVEVTGLEPDGAVRSVARRSLGAGELSATVLPVDALTYFRRRGPRYDVILDDVFAPRNGRLARPGDLSSVPILARRRLRAGGLYGVNLSSPGGEVERSTVLSVRRAFRRVRVVYTRDFAHKVVLGSDRPFRRGAVQEAIRTTLGTHRVSAARLGIGRVRR